MELRQAITLIDSPLVRGGHAPVRWADLGAGSGLFSRALATLLAPGSLVYLIDREPVSPPPAMPPGIRAVTRTLDFVRGPWGTGKLDGVLMANSLHYVADQAAFLRHLKSCLSPGGRLLIVEYDHAVSVPRWVPYPFPFAAAVSLLPEAGFTGVTRLGEMPSRYNRGMLYAVTAVSASAG